MSNADFFVVNNRIPSKTLRKRTKKKKSRNKYFEIFFPPTNCMSAFLIYIFISLISSFFWSYNTAVTHRRCVFLRVFFENVNTCLYARRTGGRVRLWVNVKKNYWVIRCRIQSRLLFFSLCRYMKLIGELFEKNMDFFIRRKCLTLFSWINVYWFKIDRNKWWWNLTGPRK